MADVIGLKRNLPKRQLVEYERIIIRRGVDNISSNQMGLIKAFCVVTASLIVFAYLLDYIRPEYQYYVWAIAIAGMAVTFSLYKK